jgi:glycosyltransferase involved in cell wall biosynthesis
MPLLNNELVSIGVASYNNKKYIIETLESIAQQEYSNIEIIIADDGSTDDSVSIINEWIGRKNNAFQVIFLPFKLNRGITKTLNSILNNVSVDSKYLIIIGSDDVMKSDRIVKQVELFRFAEPSAACVLSDMEMINEKSEIFVDSYFEYIGVTKKSIEEILSLSIERQIETCIRGNFFPAPSMIYKTDVIKKLGGWDEDLYFEDWDMNLRLISHGYKFVLTDEKLVQYRRSQNSVMSNPNNLYVESVLNLCYKYISINEQIDSAINEKIIVNALNLYQSGNKNSFKWLARKLKLNFTYSTCYYTIMSFLRIPYSVSNRFLDLIKRKTYNKSETK